MHPNDPHDLDFTLDDIIREFSEPELDDILQEVQPEPETLPPEERKTPPVSPLTADTVRLDTVTTTAASAAPSQNTAVFQPVIRETTPEEPEEMPELIPEPEPEEPPTEPFSDEWEPEYDEPMGDYPHPIAFPKKNRQTELRKKLVAGPEKRYHALAADGIGKLQLSIVLHLILFVASAAGAVLVSANLVDGNQLQLLIFAQLIIAMMAGLLGCYRLLVGMGSLLRKRFTLNTLLLVAFIACMVDGFFCLNTQRMPLTPLLCLDLLMAQWAEYQRRNTQIGQMDTLRKALDVTALVKVDNYFEGKPAYTTAEGDPDAFMDEYYKPTAPERWLELFSLGALVVSVGLSVFVGIRSGWPTAVQVLSAALLAAVPASSLIIISRPIAVLEGRLHRLGAVLCGWKGIREADRFSVYPLKHDDLFPTDCAKLNGVKFYGTVDPGRVVAYSTALIAHDGDGMMRIFSHLPRSRNIHQHQVTDFLAYPGGITGLVDGWNVLVGTQEFLTEMGIPVPEDAQLPQAIYASVDGQFSAVFALQYNRNKSTANALRTLCGYRRVTAVLTARDFILTDHFISSKLGVNVQRMVFPERQVRQELAAKTVPEDAPVVALVTKSGLASRAYALTGARALRNTLIIGSIVHIFAGLAGLAAVLALTLTNSLDVLNAQNLLAYSLVWLVPGIMITEWTRYI